jgi:hypothetical protein
MAAIIRFRHYKCTPPIKILTDSNGMAHANCAHAADPAYVTYGPQDEQEFLSLLKITGG